MSDMLRDKAAMGDRLGFDPATFCISMGCLSYSATSPPPYRKVNIPGSMFHTDCAKRNMYFNVH